VSNSDDSKRDRAVANELAQEKSDDRQVKKLLFLGSGGSGKSTLFKQLRSIHGEGFLDKDRIAFKDHVYSQIIEQMKSLIESCRELRESGNPKYENMILSDNGQTSAQFIEYVRGDIDVNEEVAIHIEVLWAESALRATFELRGELKIEDSSAYFFDHVKRISGHSYIPTDKDILFVRHRTTGVIEQKLKMDNNHFHIFDVGGQRSERKKWIHCFEHVTAVIFVASLSSYNEVMFEDDSSNAMHDSINLFDEICNSRWFIQTAMILFLNKMDLFAEKIQKYPLTVCFQDYQGEETYEHCIQYIKKQFEDRLVNPHEKQIYTHVTMATDRDNVIKVFADVQHIVIQASLQKGGLL
jgi:GTPase SAR1 family protein